MPRLELPGYLGEKLPWTSRLGRDVSALADTVSAIATHNRTPFFPAYTDHHLTHVAATLGWCVGLTPTEAVPLLGEEDAGAIVGATLLRDLALHVDGEGFVELIGGGWPAPLPWFDRPHRRRGADLPWPDLWQEFKVEVRHLDHAEIVRILGPDHDGIPSIVFEDGVHPRRLDGADRLVVGEFLRRHQARLTHEIAVFGFPALRADWSPGPRDLRALMGLVARAHHEDLRVVLDHLDDYERDRAPAGVHVPYAAALLRIADYAQMGGPAAPSLLLRMGTPQSADSIRAWSAHQAVTTAVVDDSQDPSALRFRVSPGIELTTFLQLEQIFDDLQREMDSCAAVLAEVYGASGTLSGLRLAKQRVRTNMDSPAFLDALPFVPRDARLRSAEDLFRLMADDLYGDHPWVAGRELAQNALDAVRERWRVAATGTDRAGDEVWPDPDDPSVDVLVEVLTGDDGQLTLRVADRGIGMTADTVVDFFLSAGASLGPSPRELSAVPASDAAQYVKAGRFGIGVLAAFLLGDEVEVRTRHVSAETGLALTAHRNTDLYPIARGVEMPVGTEVRVTVSASAWAGITRSAAARVESAIWRSGSDRPVVAAGSALAALIRVSCALTRPVVKVLAPAVGGQRVIDLGTTADPADEHWQELEVPGYARVHWSMLRCDGEVIHNGLLLFVPEQDARASSYGLVTPWARTILRTLPGICVADDGHLLPLTLTRYSVRDRRLPFEDELLRSVSREIVAWFLVDGGAAASPVVASWRPMISGPAGWVPPLPGLGRTSMAPVVTAVAGLADDARGPHGVGSVRFDRDLNVWAREATDLAGASMVTSEMTVRGLTGLLVSDLELLGYDRSAITCAHSERRTRGARRLADELGASLVDREAADRHPVLGPALAVPGVETAIAVSGEADPARLDGRSAVVGDTWMEVVGRPVPYHAAERLALAAQVYEEHPEMRSHIDRQRRLAAQQR